MATEFCIYQVEENVDVNFLPWDNRFKYSIVIYTERHPSSEFYDLRDALYEKNKGGDDFVEILPEDYILLQAYVDLSKYEKQGHKFVCCII